MVRDEAKPVLAMLAGFWPVPELSAEEATAWLYELTDPDLRVTVDEAREVIRTEAKTGREFRPRPGWIGGAVKHLRHRRTFDGTVPALVSARGGEASPERAKQWIAVCRRVAGGMALDEAKVAEGICG